MQTRGVEFKLIWILCLLTVGLASCKPDQKQAAADDAKIAEPAKPAPGGSQPKTGPRPERVAVPAGQAAYVPEPFGPDSAKEMLDEAARSAMDAAGGLQRGQVIALSARRLLSKALLAGNKDEVLKVSPSDSVDDEAVKVSVSNILSHVVGKVLKCDEGFFLKVVSKLPPPRRLISDEARQRLKEIEASSVPFRPPGTPPSLSERLEADAREADARRIALWGSTNEVVSFLIQFKRPLAVSIETRPIGEAGNLNGVKWVGSIEAFGSGPFRVFVKGSWTHWVDSEAGLKVLFNLQKSREGWHVSLEESSFTAIRMTSDEEVFAHHTFESIGDRTKLPAL